MLWNVVDAGNTACGYLGCKGWDKTLASKAITFMSHLVTVLNFGKIAVIEIKVGKDLQEVSNDLHQYGRSSPITKKAAHLTCIDTQAWQLALYDLFPFPLNTGLDAVFPPPPCKP